MAPLNKAMKLALLTTAGLMSLNMTTVQAAEGDEVDDNKIVITGSRIKRADVEGAAPIVTISAEQINERGYTSVQDVLNDLTQNSNGSMTQQSIHGFTPAASGVNLRGAGLGRVLTLIDGKRTAKYPLAAGGTSNFNDTANIPIGAVARVDVLTSGASAIYGSDAMGGVINIILKSDFNGVTVGGRVSGTDNGGRGIQNMNLVMGTSSDKGNITFFVEYENREQLKATDREGFGIHTDLAFDSIFSSYSSYGASLRQGSLILDTPDEAECASRGLQFWGYSNSNVGGVCGFDRTKMRDLLPEQDRLSTMVKYNYDLTDDATLYGRADFTQGFVTTKIEPMPLNDFNFIVGGGNVTVNADADASLEAILDQATSFNGDFATLADGTYRYVHRAYEYGNRKNDNETKNFTFLSGVRGTLSDDIDYDVSWQYSRTDVLNWGTGYASVGGFFDMITAGNGHSLLDEISPAQVAASQYETFNRAQSNLAQFAFTLTGTAFEMSAGDAEFAAGVETTREWFTDVSDADSMAGRILSTGGASGAGSRDSDSVYGELYLPVLDNLDVVVAGRYDDYSDVGGQFTPQITAEYHPTEEIMVRALYAETFRAPDMQRIYGDPTTGFSQVTDPLGCTSNGGTVGDVTSPIAACTGELYITAITGPNTELEPETGDNFNIGVVYNLDAFDVSVDYWTLSIENIVNNLGAQTILNNPETYGNLITRDGEGLASLVNATAQNLSMFESEGVDVAANYRLETDIGKFKLGFALAYNLKDQSQFDSLSDITDNMEITNIPDYRANLRATWSLNDLTSTLMLSHISQMNGTNKSAFVPDDIPVYGRQYIPSYSVINWTMGYNYGNSSVVTVGINNLADQGPIEDKTNWSWPHYPRAYQSPVGREFFVSFSHSM